MSGTYPTSGDTIKHRIYDVLFNRANYDTITGSTSFSYINSGRIDVSRYYTKGFIAYTSGSSLDIAMYAWYDSSAVFPTGSILITSGSIVPKILTGSSLTTPWKYLQVLVVNTGSSAGYSGSKINVMVIGQT